jgi:hypothetical protein
MLDQQISVGFNPVQQIPNEIDNTWINTPPLQTSPFMLNPASRKAVLLILQQHKAML